MLISVDIIIETNLSTFLGMISPFFVFARLRLLTLLLEFKNHLEISLGSKLNIFKNLNNLTGALLIYQFSPNKDYEMTHFINPICIW